MKTLFLYFALLATVMAQPLLPSIPTNIVALKSRSGSVHLWWQANEETNMAGYFVHYGPAPGRYTNTTFVGMLTNVFAAVGETGRVWLAVSALNDWWLESDLSDPITAVVETNRPARPVGVHTMSLRVVLDGADEIDGPYTPTQDFPEMLVSTKKPRRFYRPRLVANDGPLIYSGE